MSLGLLLLPLVCCGLPVLIAAGALGGIASALGNPWLIGTAVLIIAGLALLARRRGVIDQDSYCAPDRAGSTTPTDERSN